MQPGTVVWPHTGPTNARLRLHLGLVVPEDYKNVNLTVAEQTRYWEEGKVLTFDDSFEHSVMHHGEHYRNRFSYCLQSIFPVNFRSDQMKTTKKTCPYYGRMASRTD